MGSAQVFSRQDAPGLTCSRHLASLMREGEQLSQAAELLLVLCMLPCCRHLPWTWNGNPLLANVSVIFLSQEEETVTEKHQNDKKMWILLFLFTSIHNGPSRRQGVFNTGTWPGAFLSMVAWWLIRGHHTATGAGTDNGGSRQWALLQEGEVLTGRPVSCGLRFVFQFPQKWGDLSYLP